MAREIRFLRRDQIEAAHWDACVDASPDARVYALSWYLDLVAPDWNALVLGDYEAVFPLPTNRKLLGLPQVYAPLLCQQLGPFSPLPHPEHTARFLAEATKRWYWRFSLPLHAHATAPLGPPWRIRKLPNFVLRLDKPYAQLQAAYSENHRRNVRKAHLAGLRFGPDGLSPRDFIAGIRLHQQTKGNRVPSAVYPLALRLLESALQNGHGLLLVATDPHTLKPYAAAFWLRYQNRWTDLLNLTLPEGRASGAMHGLVNHLVQSRADTGEILDFEGSSIPSLARFYSGFGATDEPFWMCEKGW